MSDRFVFFATHLLDTIAKEGKISEVTTEDLLTAYDAQQTPTDQELRVARLAGKDINVLPIYDTLCHICGEAATMSCKTCNLDTCDLHDNESHRRHSRPPHIRGPVKPPLNTTRKEVGRKVLTVGEDGTKHVGKVKGLYIERIPNRKDKTLAVLYFADDDFMDVTIEEAQQMHEDYIAYSSKTLTHTRSGQHTPYNYKDDADNMDPRSEVPTTTSALTVHTETRSTTHALTGDAAKKLTIAAMTTMIITLVADV